VSYFRQKTTVPHLWQEAGSTAIRLARSGSREFWCRTLALGIDPLHIHEQRFRNGDCGIYVTTKYGRRLVWRG
jgi:hypothetical protein